MNEKNLGWAASLTGNGSIADVIAAGKKPQGGKAAVAVLPGMHVGRGQRYGNVTWFPIWTDAPVVERDYTTKPAAGEVAVVEQANPTVGVIEIENSGDKPVLLIEGDLLEGGWQHRALTRTVLVAAKSNTKLPVVCVEAGRWGGASVQRLGNKSAPVGVRSAIRGIKKNEFGVINQASADQGEVWDSVRAYSAMNKKARPTESLVEVQNELEAELAALKLEKPQALLGQRGVLIALGGKPLALEVFDHPDTLAERLETLLDAYLPQSLAQKFVECPARHARDFIVRVEMLGVEPTESAERMRNRPDKVVAAEAFIRNDQLLHMSALNAAHELVLAA
ncbi:MAG: hypothetical protein ORN27_05825 [Rhodoluna sp.]|nr:hypothetical protein [Rhodoluna sp.]